MRLGVFCGSGLGNAPVFREQVGELGRLLANEGIGLVYGGAHVGLMGVSAETLTLVTVVDAPAHGYSAGTTVRMTCYRADYIGDVRPDSEIEDVSWLSSTDRPRCAPAAQRVLDAIHARGWIR